MSARYSQSFKQQAIEKALSRSDGTTLEQITDSLGIGHSTLHKWMVKSRKQQLGSSSEHDSASISGVRKEKRPQDWSQAERLDMVIACGSLDEVTMNQLCRERGLYAHHVTQWKQDFISGSTANERSDAKHLKGEVRALKKELNRKDKALADDCRMQELERRRKPKPKQQRCWYFKKKSARFGAATRTTHDERASTNAHHWSQPGHARRRTPVSGLRCHRYQREDIATLGAARQHTRWPLGCAP